MICMIKSSGSLHHGWNGIFWWLKRRKHKIETGNLDKMIELIKKDKLNLRLELKIALHLNWRPVVKPNGGKNLLSFTDAYAMRQEIDPHDNWCCIDNVETGGIWKKRYLQRIFSKDIWIDSQSHHQWRGSCNRVVVVADAVFPINVQHIRSEQNIGGHDSDRNVSFYINNDVTEVK